ncbi:MAG: hypothetical protein OHK0039_19230 [Bacteroidia bacterium]
MDSLRVSAFAAGLILVCLLFLPGLTMAQQSARPAPRPQTQLVSSVQPAVQTCAAARTPSQARVDHPLSHGQEPGSGQGATVQPVAHRQEPEAVSQKDKN